MNPFSTRPDEPIGLLLRLGRVRWGLLVAAIFLMLIGLATVHSASSELSVDYLPRQAAWIGIGLAIMLIAFSIDYQLLLAFAWPIYGLSIVSLLLILLLGHEAGGARSWLGFGGFGGQPAEFAKLATALLLGPLPGGGQPSSAERAADSRCGCPHPGADVPHRGRA